MTLSEVIVGSSDRELIVFFSLEYVRSVMMWRKAEMRSIPTATRTALGWSLTHHCLRACEFIQSAPE